MYGLKMGMEYGIVASHYSLFQYSNMNLCNLSYLYICACG